MSGATHFSQSYAQARQRFLDAARAQGAAPASYPHPRRHGAQGEDLAIDTALVGAADSANLFIVSSGTHGPEGFAGSACQLALLDDAPLLQRAADRGVAILLVHAVNPFGFSHLARTNEDNVDLNRNFNDFGQPYPRNEVYERLHGLLLPESWPPSPEHERRLDEAMRQAGGNVASGVSSGQATHPDGLFYSGVAPSWSNETIRAILRREAAGRRHIAWVDVHTGLGPYGHGEKIFGRHPEATVRRAFDWWGRDLIASGAPESVSPRTTGHITSCASFECPDAAITPMTLEYGTLPSPLVRRALRGEAWLAGHRDASADIIAAIRRDVRAAFYVEAHDWKGMVLGQFRAIAIQTVNGLGSV